MDMIKIFIIFCRLLMPLLLVGCKQLPISASPPPATTTAVIATTAEFTENTPNTGVRAQASVRVPQSAIVLGTPENPTIDGGVINIANFNVGGELSYPQTASRESLRDNWATSSRVKKFLEEAVRNGKLEYVLQKIDEKGLPASVATVPMIESGYRETATSPKGAAGVWQLMPQTAKAYGVSKEERYKLISSTGAALNLLQNLYQQFNSWELAFAAYNAGAPRVQQALRQNPHATSVQELDLPGETKDYVARIMALNKKIESL